MQVQPAAAVRTRLVRAPGVCARSCSAHEAGARPGCVCARTHTRTRAQKRLRPAHTQLAQQPCPPPRPVGGPLPPPTELSPIPIPPATGFGLGQLELPTVPKKQKFGAFLVPTTQTPTDSWFPQRVCDEEHLSDPWAPGHAVLCVCVEVREEIFHSKSHAMLVSVGFFSEHLTHVGPIVGGRTENSKIA
jgi:hypothetical protein